MQSIAKANSREIKEKIPYLSNRIIAQIIAAAKVSYNLFKRRYLCDFYYNKLQLLILQRAEDLKDECADVLDGIQVSQIES